VQNPDVNSERLCGGAARVFEPSAEGSTPLADA